MVLGGQVPRLYGGTILGGCNTLWVSNGTLNTKVLFLGGLSLHLNHLIPWRMEISHRLFGTLPIGLLLSNLDSRQLETSPMTSYDQF